MAESVLDMVLLTGRLPGEHEGWPLPGFLDRLAARGISARVICIDLNGEDPIPGLIECPALGRRWMRPWALRNLSLDRNWPRPRLLHVLEADLAEIGLELAERWQIPYLVSAEEFLPPGGRLRLSRNWCRAIVAVCPELADELHKELGVPGELIQVIPRGLIIEGHRKAELPTQRIPVIGACGPLTFRSGFASFLTAARRVLDAGFDVEFVIAGLGEDELELRRRADRLRITNRVTFAGEPAVGQKYWDLLDVYCQTSLIPTVGQHLAMALSHGVPCIATDVDGLRALIEPDQTGLRVPPNDSSSLAKAILQLLEAPELAQQLGEKGREASRSKHDPDQEVDRLNELYRWIVGSETPAVLRLSS